VTRRGAADGKTTYHYLNDSNPSARSLVVSETMTNGANRVVKQTDNGYYNQSADMVPLRKVYLRNYEVFGACLQFECPPPYYTIVGETYETEWDSYQCFAETLLGSAREQHFATPVSGGAQPVVHESLRTFSYARLPTGQLFALPSWVHQFLNRGEQLATHTTYAREYAAGAPADAPAAGLADLAAHHVLAAVVETQRWRHRGSDSVLVGGDLTHYQNLQPRRSWALEAAAPVAPASFASSRILNQRFAQDARYVETASYDRYDSWGNVTEEHYRAKYASFLWDDRGTNLLAKADQAHFGQVAYTSFEPAASGRWRYDTTATAAHGFTGRWSYAWGGAAVVRDSVPAGTYALTLWATALPAVQLNGASVPSPAPVANSTRDGRLFQCYNYRLPMSAPLNTVAVSGPGGELLDEMRLCPSGALMQSYTHDPLAGLASQTDPSGRTTTYEYDALGRLVRTRDEQGRVLSQQQYHYARP